MSGAESRIPGGAVGRALKVACPVCGARPYRLCTEGAYVAVPHFQRVLAAAVKIEEDTP